MTLCTVSGKSGRRQELKKAHMGPTLERPASFTPGILRLALYIISIDYVTASARPAWLGTLAKPLLNLNIYIFM